MAGDVTVATTRLSPPRLSWAVVDRPRLLKQLIEADTIAFVTGPAGAGKSTLLAQAFATLPDAAWISLDTTDNDPTHLWTAISDSVAAVIPAFGSTFRKLLATRRPRVIERIVPAFVNELAASGRSVRLFFDDLHVITNAESLRSIEMLLDQRPGKIAVTIASREASPFPLQRHRLEGRLIDLGPADLAMDPNEAAEMLTAAGVHIDRAEGDRLHRRLEGWVAGLRWAAMALQEDPDIDRFIGFASSPDSDLARYIVEEILDRQPDDRRQFMLETSVLRRLDSGACDAVRDRSDSGVLLEQLERSNALVTGTDTSDGCYRYHHLGRKLQLARLEREAPDMLPLLHRRAAAWYLDHGEIPSAVEHALEAGDRILAADALCSHWWSLVNGGQIQTVVSLLERFHPSQIHGYPPLAAAASLLYGIDGDEARSRRFYASALEGDYRGPPPDGAASFASTLAILRGALVFDGVWQSRVDGELAYSLEPPESPWRPLAAMVVGLARIWTGDPEAATPYLTEVAQAHAADQAIVVYAMAELALQELETDPAQARAMAEHACALAADAGVESLVTTSAAHAAAALAYLSLGDHCAAAEHVDAAEGPVRDIEQGLPVDSMRISLLLADASLRLGCLEGAQRYIDEAVECAAVIPDTGDLGDQLTTLRGLLDLARSERTCHLDVTDREMDVLELLATELTTREIGEQLYISKNTVKTYQLRLYKKLGVRTRADAVAAARSAGLIPERCAIDQVPRRV